MLDRDKEYTGTVVWFRPDKGFGYGFIKLDNDTKELFVHYTGILNEGFKSLKKGQAVKFRVGENRRGEEIAVDVSVNE